jgi:hypothetical protein
MPFIAWLKMPFIAWLKMQQLLQKTKKDRKYLSLSCTTNVLNSSTLEAGNFLDARYILSTNYINYGTRVPYENSPNLLTPVPKIVGLEHCDWLEAKVL